MIDVEADLPDSTTPLDFLKLVYCSHAVPLAVRMKAAIEAAPFVHPKLAVSAQLNGEDFARSLELATQRSAQVLERSPKKIGHHPLGTKLGNIS